MENMRNIDRTIREQDLFTNQCIINTNNDQCSFMFVDDGEFEPWFIAWTTLSRFEFPLSLFDTDLLASRSDPLIASFILYLE